METVVDGPWKQAEAVINNVLLPNNYGVLDSLYIVGSDAHGTKLSPEEGGSDDTDYMGIFMSSAANILGSKPFHHYTYNNDGLDIVLYSFPKLMSMLKSANPNVLGLLFYQGSRFVPIYGPVMRRLRDSRDLFLSRLLYDRFDGYAKSQLKATQKAEFKGWMGATRKAAVEKVGYDTKAAAHALRVLWMGQELFSTGFMYINREGIDSHTLKNIKRGFYDLEVVLRWVDEAKVDLRNAWEDTDLPDTPNWEAQEKLLVDVMTTHILIDALPKRYRSMGQSMGFGMASGITVDGLTDHLRIPGIQAGEISGDMNGNDAENSPDIAGSENSPNVGGGQIPSDKGWVMEEFPENSLEFMPGYSEHHGAGVKFHAEVPGDVWASLEVEQDRGGYLETM